MKLRKQFIKRVTEMIERPGMGLWPWGHPRKMGVYLFLFGDSAEDLAWLLPSRDQMRAHSSRSQPAGSVHAQHELRLVGISDRTSVVNRLVEAGHRAINVAGHDRLDHDDSWQWFYRLIVKQMKKVRLQAVMLTPEFVSEFCRPHRLLGELRSLRRRLELFNPGVMPSFLVTDTYTEFYPLVHFIKKFNDRKSKPKLQLFHYGSPAMYDYDRRTNFFPSRTIIPLGWRIPRPDKPHPLDGPSFFVYFHRMLAARDLLAELKRLMAPLGISRIVIHAGPGLFIRDDPAYQYVSDRQAFYNQAMTSPGLLITDGDAPLLPFLSNDCRVVLIRNATQSKASLIRCAYFLGHERWPTFDSVRDLAEVLGRSHSLDDFWSSYRGRTSPLEEEERPSFHQCFTSQLYKAFLPTDEPKSVSG